jgi:hypothetical protein
VQLSTVRFNGSSLKLIAHVQINFAHTALHSGSYNNSLLTQVNLYVSVFVLKSLIPCYPAVHVGKPLHLAELVTDYWPIHSLQSADSHLLIEPRSKTDAFCAPPHIFGVHSIVVFTLLQQLAVSGHNSNLAS